MPVSTAKLKQRFIKEIECGSTVGDAALAIGVQRPTLYRWANADPAFADAWDQARNGPIPYLRLLDTACDLAIEGDVELLKFFVERHDLLLAGCHDLPGDSLTLPVLKVRPPGRPENKN